jgi:transcriptional regulator with XRE-family HTH domain
MTIQEFLAQDGLTAEQIAAIVGDPIQSKLMTRALARFEEGNTSLTAAQADKAAAARERADATDFWEKKVTPALADVDKRVGAARSEAAGYRAYLQSLKDGGYDVPDEVLKAAPADAPKPKYMTQEDLDKVGRGTAPTLIQLTQLSNEYTDLYGAPYLNMEQDFEAAQTARKPFREFVRDKYAFATKREERSAAKAKADEEAIRKDERTKAQADFAKTNGSNDGLRAPVPSKFDKLTKQEGFKSDSWKSREGRQANRTERLKRFENVTLQ